MDEAEKLPTVRYRNAVLLPDGRIDCELDHPVHGWIPFAADPFDVSSVGRAIHADILAQMVDNPDPLPS